MSKKLGSPAYQVKNALSRLERFGQSRYEDKQRGIAEGGIYSFSTRQVYQRDCSRFAAWAKKTYGVRDIRNLTPEHAQAYLDSLSSRERSGGYLGRIKAAIGKLSIALHGQKWDLGESWHSDRRPERAYTPDQAKQIEANLREHARDKQAADVVHLQRIAGLRVREAVMLRGQDIDPERCVICLKRGTKGGRTREVRVAAEHRGYLQSLEERAERHRDGHVFQGRGSLSKRTENAVSLARRRLNLEDSAGTHGFRKTFARQRYREYREAGLTDRQARWRLAGDLGHGRIDVTYSYVARQ